MNRLTEAIEHCYDVANSTCGECGKEHLQLAKWLEELKAYKGTGLEPEEVYKTIKAGVPEWIPKYLEYRKLEEQGLLIKLPCKVRDTIYWVWCDSGGNPDGKLEEEEIKYFYVDDNKGIGIATDYYDGWIGNYTEDGALVNDVRRIFLDKKEAEKALEEMSGKIKFRGPRE